MVNCATWTLFASFRQLRQSSGKSSWILPLHLQLFTSFFFFFKSLVFMDSRHHCQQQLKLCDSKTATRFSAGALSKTMCRCSSTVRSQILFRTQAMVLHAPIDKYFTLFYLLAVPHSQTHGLVPVSMADRSLVSTTDCILLNQSNYRK